MFNKQLARDLLALCSRDVQAWDSYVLDHCTATYYLTSVGLRWRAELYAVWTDPDKREIRVALARRWGRGYRYIMYVDYATLLRLA